MKNNKKGLISFFICVTVFSAVVDYLIAKGGSEYLYLVLMWMPALAAFISAAVLLKKNGERVTVKAILRECRINSWSWRGVLAGALIPLIYLTVPYILYWIIRPGSFSTNATNPLGMIIGLLISVVLGNLVSLISALGEEIGWRGFMVPKLAKQIGVKKTLVASSLIWCLWHFPLIIFDGYMAGTPLWYNLIAFVLCIFPVGIIAGLLSMETGSVWPAAMLHAAHNNYDQSILGLMTTGDDKMYFVSETGVFTVVCAWILSIIMYVRFRKKNMEKPDVDEGGEETDTAEKVEADGE